MKKLIILLMVCILAIPIITFAQVNVRGYWRDSNHDGIKDTYVQPYQRSAPDGIRSNNYDYPGNFNPNSGQITGGNPPLFDNSLGSSGSRQRRGW